MKRHVLLSAVALSLAAGCVQYNDRCTGFVDHPDETAGYIGSEDVFLDKPNARQANNALGQMAADAFLHAEFLDGKTPQFAVYNGGGIRAEGLCQSHNILAAGSKVSKGLIHEIFLFDNLVQTVDVTGKELLDLMEASAQELVATGPISDPSDNFLQPAGGEVGIDCSRPPKNRITRFRVGTDDLLLPANQAKHYRLATIAFLLSDGAITDALRDASTNPSRTPAQASKLGGRDSNLIHQYMGEHYDDPSRGLVLDRTHGADGRSPRIQFANCAQPERPAAN